LLKTKYYRPTGYNGSIPGDEHCESWLHDGGQSLRTYRAGGDERLDSGTPVEGHAVEGSNSLYHQYAMHHLC